MAERLDDGLRAIEEHAATLMREIATEMWRTSGARIPPTSRTVCLSFISRDQAIKSLIAASDDRFQALALRTARLEDALAELAENGRLVREAIPALGELGPRDRELSRRSRASR